MATVTVDPNTDLQVIHGWQVTAQAGQSLNATTDDEDEYPSTTYDNYKDDLLAALLDVGINAFRIEVNVADWNATGYSTVPSNAAIQPSTATSGQKHFDRYHQMMDDVVLPMKTLLQARGETPHITLCIVDFRQTGYDLEETPSEYAFFVNAVIEDFEATYGFYPDAIEAILEPDNGAQAAQWTADRVADNVVAAQALLTTNGHGTFNWIVPSVTSVANATTYISDMKTGNAGLEALAWMYSYHRYGGDNSDVADVWTEANADGKLTGMLEVIGATHLNLYDDLVTGHNSMWQQFTIAYPESFQTDNGGHLFVVNRSTWAVTAGTRTPYLKPYFFAVRRGAQRKGASIGGTGSGNGAPLYFVNTNGSEIVVVKCSGAVDLALAGLQNNGVTMKVRYTTGDGTNTPSAEWQSLSDVTVSGGATASRSMPAAGVVVFYDEEYLTQPPGDKWYKLAFS